MYRALSSSMSNHTRLNVARFQVLLLGNTSSLSSSNLDHLIRDHHIGQLTAKKFLISSNRPRALWITLPSRFCRTDGKCKAVLAQTTLQRSTEVVFCAKRERDPRALSSRKPARSYSWCVWSGVHKGFENWGASTQIPAPLPSSSFI